MGNTNDSIDNCQDNQEFQSIKTSYRPSRERDTYQNLDIQALTYQQKYLKWLKEMTDYLKFLSHQTKLSAQQINQRFWLPIKKDFVSNQSFCKTNKGRAILTFEGGFCNLTQQVINRSFNNNPFTVTQLWKLLYYLSQSSLLFRNRIPKFQINPNKLMIDSGLTNIKFLTPFTQFQPFIPVRTESFVSPQKLRSINRKTNASLQIQNKNDDFVVGMLLAECILLQSCSSLYQLGIDGKKYLNQQALSEICRKILRISYYPVKLKLVAVGLIRFQDDQRLTLYQVSQLLKSHRKKILLFQTFHLRRTEFANVFGIKLDSLQNLVGKAKIQASKQIFHKGLATLKNQAIKQVKIIHPHINALIETKDLFPHGDNFTNKTRSLNFSMSHIPKKERKGDDSESLVWSKSQLKSIRQHSAGSPRLKQSAKQQQEKNQPHYPTLSQVCARFDEFRQENLQKEAISKDLFEPFKKESNLGDAANEIEQNQQQPSSLKKAQSLATQNIIEHNGIKIQRTFSIQFNNGIPNYYQGKKNSQVDNFQKEKQQKTKAKQQFQQRQLFFMNKIQSKQESKPKIPLAKKPLEKKQQSNKLKESLLPPMDTQRQKSNEDSISEVGQYKSYLYQSPQFDLETNISPIPCRNEGILQTTQQKDILKIVQSNLQAQHVQNQSSNRKKGFSPESYQSPEANREKYPQNRPFRHSDSLINSLTNLMSSKKDASQSLKSNNSPFVPAETKVAEYMKGFSKFSPELIAQLNFKTSYPDDQRLKLKARESLNTNYLIINQTRELFPLTQYPLNSQQQTKL